MTIKRIHISPVHLILKFSSNSKRLRETGESTMNLFGVLFFVRLATFVYSLIVISFIVFKDHSLTDISAIVICIWLLSHTVIKKYYDLVVNDFKTLSSDSEFVPLKTWMVENGKSELTGEEYNELFNEIKLSKNGAKLLNSLKSKGSITIYDRVNLALYEYQYGNPQDYREEKEFELIRDNNLRDSIKDSFKDMN